MTKTTKMTTITSVVFLSFLLSLLILGIVFVLPGTVILPQYFSIGPISIHYYGMCMALAVGAGMYLAQRRVAQYGIDSKRMESVLLWVVIAGFLGARLYHVLSSFGYYQSHPADIFKVWNGGLSIYGAVIGGIVALAVCSKILGAKTSSEPAPHLMRGQVLKSSILNFLDWLVPSVVVGQIIGRFGNMFNYELYGHPTNLPWKMFVPGQFRLAGYEAYSYFHPLFLYEIIWNAFVLFILLYIEKKRYNTLTPSTSPVAKAGWLFFWYLLLYNTGRFFLEFLRVDSTFFGPVRINAAVSLALVCVGIGGIVLIRKSSRHAKIS